jgi:muramoyltetrapeptide carboxypeptidase
MINRREFIKGSAVLSGLSLMPFSETWARQVSNLSSTRSLPKILPERLKKGDVIGLVTPSAGIKKEELEQTIETLKGLGFQSYYLDSVLYQYGYFAGTDKERADELMHMFSNREVKGILCVRGGYGAVRILDLLDYDVIQKNPKPLIGYSDITALDVAIYERTGLVTFHGPVGISNFNDFSVTSFENVLMYPKKKYTYHYQREEGTENNPEFDRYTITPGKAEGELMGGNLSVLASMAGTPFAPDFENKIAFIEEIDEKTYRVDRMLTQLVQATNLGKANGIVLGIFDKCSPRQEPSLTLKQAISDILKPFNIPVAYGLPFGHVNNKITLPVGIQAKFNATKQSLRLMEAAVK